MKKIMMSALILFSMSLGSLAFAHTCPSIGEITQFGKKLYVSADSADEDLGWIGKAEGGAGQALKFLNVFYEAKNKEKPFTEGALLYCRYRLQDGGTLDLRLMDPSGQKVDNLAQIEESNKTNWKPFFGKKLYACMKGTEACQFNLTNYLD